MISIPHQTIKHPPLGRFRLDTVRLKTKRVFSGQYRGHTMRLTRTCTQEDKHATMGGCCPEVQEALREGRMGDGTSMEALEALVAFCQDLLAM